MTSRSKKHLRVFATSVALVLTLALRPQLALAVGDCFTDKSPYISAQKQVGQELVATDYIEQDWLWADLFWGDGAKSNYLGYRGDSPSLAHTYTTPGQYRITANATGAIRGQQCSAYGHFAGTATITAAPVVPRVSIEDARASEELKSLTFALLLSEPAPASTRVSVRTTNLSATSDDYAGTSGAGLELQIPEGKISASITLPVIDDTLLEVDEQFQVAIVATGNVFIGSKSKATGTILDNDRAVVTVTTFIPSAFVMAPPWSRCKSAPSGGMPPVVAGPSLTKQYLIGLVSAPVLIHRGDNRGFDPNASSFRTRQTVTVAPSEIVPMKGPPINETGETTAYAPDALEDGKIDAADNDEVLNDCHLRHAVGHAPTSGMSVTADKASDGVVVIHFDTKPVGFGSTNPLVLAVGIDWDFKITIDTSGSAPRYAFLGTHDGFPAYEVYANGSKIYTYTPGPGPYSFKQVLDLLPPEDASANTAGPL